MATAAASGLHPHVELLFEADPILASGQGDERAHARLGDIEPDAIEGFAGERRRLLADAEQRPMPAAGTREWLEHSVLLTELRTSVRRHDVERVWERAPYWYAERMGDALSVLMRGDLDPAFAGEALLARLRGLPDHCARAKANLTEATPPLWARMGSASARGLERFVERAVPGHAETLPPALAADVVAAASKALPALGEFTAYVDELGERARGSWSCGVAHVDFLLGTFHHLDIDAGGLAEYGRSLVERERAELERFAASLDRDAPWHEQIDRIKDRHPRPPEFLSTYGDQMRRAREHTARHELVTIPDGEACEMEWVPEYQREGLPLGVMSPSPPYAPGLRSGFRITPADPEAPHERVREHMRDNCYAFAASIAGHETYPGHHLQYVHHKLGTDRGSVLRHFATPQFVEGWGLYVEDLLEETGFLADDAVRLFKRRNALWRALRVVVDVGLHTGTLTLDAAIELMRREAGMDRHMAEGEVRRYTRHDNPTYPSSYVLGRDLIHRLRSRRGLGVKAFHDWLLSHGSPPVVLLARMSEGTS
ncbi:DUF885 domain-containing protein [Pseudonocardia acaciae]|uniref:DUF885 domain-containing protein n=1 Tax=Pseudonocardia acaciae TaxID=551276 RepID=UPI0004906484|nr:DUF885 domain-containing protein [Pseudonocardia acaciae]